MKLNRRGKVNATAMYCLRRNLQILWTKHRNNELILEKVMIKARLSTTVLVNPLSFSGTIRNASLSEKKLQHKPKGRYSTK